MASTGAVDLAVRHVFNLKQAAAYGALAVNATGEACVVVTMFADFGAHPE